MRKKIKLVSALILSVLMIVGSLAGCGQKTQQSESKQTEQSQDASSTGSTEVSTPVNDEPITISILTTRMDGYETNIDKIWCFPYLEKWLAEQGYNVEIEVAQTLEAGQQISLMFGTDTLPDLIWGIQLTNEQAVIYGAEEGMLLDWTPYINEETMPNIYKLFQKNSDALLGSICFDGAIYGIPTFSQRGYQAHTGSFGRYYRAYVYQSWLDKCNLNMPTNMEEFLDMLRAFKQVKLESGEEVIPVLGSGEFFEKFLWTCLGYYGNYLQQYGTDPAIKDGELVLPCYTDGYKEFIKIMNTCYEEGLISKDYFTMDKTRVEGLLKAGVNGTMFHTSLAVLNGGATDYKDIVAIPPFKAGDAKEVFVSTGPTYKTNIFWASSDTEHPEILAKILDYVYSPEGNAVYQYGPLEEEDTLGMVDVVYLKDPTDINSLTNKTKEEGYTGSYEINFVRPTNAPGAGYISTPFLLEHFGLESTAKTYSYKDAVTGETIECSWTEKTSETVSGHWNIVSTEGTEGLMTTVYFPTAYMSEEDALELAELKLIIENHVIAESAKFITGTRPLDEIDTFMQELKSMGVEEYIALYEKAYGDYVKSVLE